MKIKSSSDNTLRLFSRFSQDTAADATIQSEIDALNPKLLGINKQIHNDPELGYAEFHAHDNITALLEAQGFKVTRHASGVPTAFQAECGSGGRVVAFNAEYDALPEIGHACGHNLIATISIAGFFGLAKAIKKFKRAGRVRLLGTPAEEGGGGKLKLIDAGAYRDVDACLMIHPGPEDGLVEDGFTGDAYMPTLANHKFTVQYTGKAAHAALAPWQGVNALDAVVLAYNAISVLRQQIKPDERIYGVISGGGSRPNIITAYGSLDYYIRAPSLKAAEELVVRAKKCFEGAALATGCSVEFKDINTYADLMPNKTICSLYTSAMSNMGSPVRCEFSSPPLAGSTDMGNVSYECPGFQGYCGNPAAPGAYNHTPGFTAAAGTEEAHTRAIATGKGIAMVGWKILTDDIVAEAIKQDFEDDLTRKDRAVVSSVRSGGCFSLGEFGAEKKWGRIFIFY